MTTDNESGRWLATAQAIRFATLKSPPILARNKTIIESVAILMARDCSLQAPPSCGDRLVSSDTADAMPQGHSQLSARCLDPVRCFGIPRAGALDQWPISRDVLTGQGNPVLQVGHSVTASLPTGTLLTIKSALFFKISLIFQPVRDDEFGHRGHRSAIIFCRPLKSGFKRGGYPEAERHGTQFIFFCHC